MKFAQLQTRWSGLVGGCGATQNATAGAMCDIGDRHP